MDRECECDPSDYGKPWCSCAKDRPKVIGFKPLDTTDILTHQQMDCQKQTIHCQHGERLVKNLHESACFNTSWKAQ